MSLSRTSVLCLAVAASIATSSLDPAADWTAPAASVPAEIALSANDTEIVWHSFAIEADRLDDIVAMDAQLHITPSPVGPLDPDGAYFVQVEGSAAFHDGVTVPSGTPTSVDLNDVVNMGQMETLCFVDGDLCWLDVTVTYASFDQATDLDIQIDFTVSGMGTIPQMVVAPF